MRRALALTALVGALALASFAHATVIQEGDVRITVLSQILLDYTRSRYGRHLNGGELRFLHRRLQQNLTEASQIKAIPLANSDEPDFLFVAD